MKEATREGRRDVGTCRDLGSPIFETHPAALRRPLRALASLGVFQEDALYVDAVTPACILDRHAPP
jgi:hypothetical protein